MPPSTHDSPADPRGAGRLQGLQRLGRAASERPFLLPAALALLIAGLYGPSLTWDFLEWDDGYMIVDNVHLRAPFLEALARIFSVTGRTYPEYLPVRDLTFLVEFQLFGLTPLFFRLNNLLLHLLNGCLLLIWLRHRGQLTGLSAAAVALFVAHPVCVESVVWIAARKDLLFFTFCLVGLNCWSRLSGTARPRLLYGVAVACLVLGLASKYTAVALPVVLLLDTVVFEDRARRREALTRLAPMFAIVAAFVVFIVLYQRQVKHATVADLYGSSYGWHLLNLLPISLHYLESALLPVRLSPRYFRVPYDSLTEPRVWLGALVFAAWVGGAAWLVRRRAPVGFHLAAAFMWVAPALNLLPTNILVADRYLYGSVPFLALAAALALEPLSRRRPTLAAGAAAAALLAACMGTVSYSNVWRNDRNLWTRVTRTSPDLYYGWGFLGDARFEAGELAAAGDAYERAIELEPGSVGFTTQAAKSRLRTGDLPRAKVLFEQALRIDARHLEAVEHLAIVHAQQGDPQGAARLFEQATGHPAAARRTFDNAVRFYMNTGAWRQAAKVAADGVARFPDAVPLYGVRAQALLHLGDLAAARDTLAAAARRFPQKHRLRDDLAALEARIAAGEDTTAP